MICPMQGKDSAEILVDYCAHTLEPARAAEFERHLEACGDCRRLVEAQGDLWAMLDRWTPAPVSPDFDARLYARIAREQATPPWTQWWRRMFRPAVPFSMWKPAVSLAAVCAVLVVGLLVRTPEPVGVTKQIRSENVDIEQVEKTLEDLDMLTPLSQGPAS